MISVHPTSNDLMTQFVYRTLLNAMACPGTVHSLRRCAAEKSDEFRDSPGSSCALFPELRWIALSLLDAETPFAVCGENAKQWTASIARLTMAPSVHRFEEAAYVINSRSVGAVAATCCASIDRGTLEAPHRGATVIHLVAALAAPPVGAGQVHLGESLRLLLRGPGIDDVQPLRVDGWDEAWLTGREVLNREYPMGVDFVLVDPMGFVAALPRTTRVIKEAESWAM